MSYVEKETARFIVNTDTFSRLITEDETFKINIGPLNCNSKKIVYLSECKKCKNPYVESIKSLSNYKSAHKSFKTKKRGTQKLFHGNTQDDHEVKDN